MSATLEITVKTLDSQNHKFDIDNQFTVKQFKETIADVVGVSAESQRLIYCGRVLHDDKKLTEYGLDKKVVHLVQKVPPSQTRPQASGASTTPPHTSTSSRRAGTNRPAGDGSMYLGALAFPSDIFSVQGTNDIIQNATQSRVIHVRNMLRRLETCLSRLEDPNRHLSPQQTTESTSSDSPNSGNDEFRTFDAELQRAFASTENTHEHIVEAVADAAEATADAVAGAVSSAIAGALSAIVSAVGNTMGAPNITVMQQPSGLEQTSVAANVEAPSGGDAQPSAVPEPSANGQSQSHCPNCPEPAAGGSGQSSDQRRQEIGPTRLSVMADLMEHVDRLQGRLRPHMQQVCQLLRTDPVLPQRSPELAEAQRRYLLVSEAMHLLSHTFHSLSDLSAGLARPPPRQLGVRSLVIQPAAVVQGFPIQAQINVMTNRVSPTSSQIPTQNRTSGVPSTDTPTTTVTTTAPSTVTAPPPTSRADNTRPFTLGPGGNLELIMEVGPSGIIFERPSSVPTTSSNSTESQGAGAQPIGGNVFLPPQMQPSMIIQDIMQAVAAQIMGGGRAAQVTNRGGVIGTPPPASSTSSSTATISSSSSISTTSSTGGGNQAGAPGQTSQARGNTATRPTTATQTRSTSRPHVHLAPLNLPGPTSFDPYLPCNSHHIQPQNVRRQVHVMQEPSVIHRRVQVPNQQNSGQPSAPQGPASFFNPAQPDSFAPNFMAQQAGRTIAEFLFSMPDYSYTRGESFFTDLFVTIAQQFTLHDLVEVSLQQSTPLNRLRQPLRTFINEQLLQGDSASAESMSRAVDRLMVEVQPYLDVVRSAQLRQDIDYEASIRQFGLARLPELIRLIVNYDDDNDLFGAQLMRLCGQFVRDLASLTLVCCHDGRQGLERILHRYVQVLTGELEPTLQQWTATNSRLPLRTFVQNLSTATEPLDAYLVRLPNTTPFPASAPAPIDASESSVQESAALTTEQEEAMDCEEDEFVLALEDPTHVAPPGVPATAADIVEDNVAATPPSLVLPRMEIDTTCDVAVGSEEWHTGLDPDWVPVITRDMQRQRRQPTEQPPFSDAYLSGMSSKRRKLIANSKPQGTVSQVISESLTQAAGAAEVATTEHLARAAGADLGLQAAYKEEVKTAVSQQLANNPDFTPDRYPNASKYFNPRNK